MYGPVPPSLQISARRIPLGTADEVSIQQAAESLYGFGDRIVSCRVAVSLPHRHHRTGMAYDVRVDVGLPRGTVVVSRHSDPSLRTAVQGAFSAARRQVQDHMVQLRDFQRPA